MRSDEAPNAVIEVLPVPVGEDAELVGGTAERRAALGYIRAHLLMTEIELADAKQDLADCAEQAGYALGTIYVERIDRVPSAFEALVTDLLDHGPTAVVLPGMHHLAALGAPGLLKTHLEKTTGARVLTARLCP